MLYRPGADLRLDELSQALQLWQARADRFRLAAVAARQGEAPDAAVLEAAADAREWLRNALAEIDTAFDTLPPGDALFAPLLRAQTMVQSLLESIGNSCDILEQRAGEAAAAERLPAALRVAAE